MAIMDVSFTNFRRSRVRRWIRATRRQMVPIGIVIPTRNAARALRGHAADLRPLLQHAAEAVVVDSSEDGTLDLLKQELRGLRVRFFQHPPGLYESWNYGIAQLRTPYTYISTVGDAISREGLAHLFETAQKFAADVVVSPPQFVDEHGVVLPQKRWPIHDLIERRQLRGPTLLDPWEVFLLQVVDAPKALIGSSAANLYRTDILRSLPFPAAYGHFGDVAWGIQHAFSTKLAVTPSVVSKFAVHQSGGAMPIEQIERMRARLLALAMGVMDQQNESDAPSWLFLLKRLRRETDEAWRLQHTFDEIRRRSFLWFLNPGAWQARRARKQQNRTLAAVKLELLKAGSSEADSPTGSEPSHASGTS